MSIIQGKSSGGEDILHITKGQNTVNELLGGVRANTVFHSSLPYLEVEEYDCTVTSTTLSQNVMVNIRPSDAFFSAVGSKAYFIALNGVVYHHNIEKSTLGYGWSSVSGFTPSSDSLVSPPSLNHPYTFVRLDTRASFNPEGIYAPFTAKAYIIKNLTADGIVSSIPTENGIFVTNNEIKVNGVNLSGFKYITNQAVNTVDLQLRANGSASGYGVQILNTRNTGTGMRMQSNALGESYISKGGHKIFSSLFGANALYSHSESFIQPSYRLDGYFGDAGGSATDIKTHSFGTGFNIGDLFTMSAYIQAIDPNNNLSLNCLSLYQYRNGTILSTSYTYRLEISGGVSGFCLVSIDNVLKGDSNGNLSLQVTTTINVFWYNGGGGTGRYFGLTFKAIPTRILRFK